LHLVGFSPTGPAEVWRLDAEHLAENIGTQDIVDGQEMTLPGHSISLYILPRILEKNELAQNCF